MAKLPIEVPGKPQQPEIIPPTEPVVPVWPIQEPEVTPKEVPKQKPAPIEVPPPPTEIITLVNPDNEYL